MSLIPLAPSARALGWVALVAGLSACSLSGRSLVLVSISAAPGVDLAAHLVELRAGDVEQQQRGPLSRLPQPPLRFGVYLPRGTKGPTAVTARALDGAGCVLASAAITADVAEGEQTFVTLLLEPAPSPCPAARPPDAGVDALVPADDGGVTPAVDAELPGETDAQNDSPTDGGALDRSTAPPGTDAGTIDGAPCGEKSCCPQSCTQGCEDGLEDALEVGRCRVDLSGAGWSDGDFGNTLRIEQHGRALLYIYLTAPQGAAQVVEPGQFLAPDRIEGFGQEGFIVSPRRISWPGGDWTR